MILSKTEEAASADQIEQWVNSFDEVELFRHGWSRPRVVECFEKYEYLYQSSHSALKSVIFYHFPDIDTLEIIFLATVPYERLMDSMRSLFSALLEQHQDKQIWLECREDNLPAIKLYRKLGLRETGRRAKYYHDGTTAILFNF